MITIHNEMLSAMMALHLETELAAYDDGNGQSTCWFNAASHALNEIDHDKLVAAARKRVTKLRKEANGCPSNVWKWREHYTAQ